MLPKIRTSYIQSLELTLMARVTASVDRYGDFISFKFPLHPCERANSFETTVQVCCKPPHELIVCAVKKGIFCENLGTRAFSTHVEN